MPRRGATCVASRPSPPPAADWRAGREPLSVDAVAETPPSPPDLDRLGVISREVDVLRLVAAGCTNAEIAQRLYLSPRTVKGYVEQLLAKTAAANRTQLATRWETAEPS